MAWLACCPTLCCTSCGLAKSDRHPGSRITAAIAIRGKVQTQFLRHVSSSTLAWHSRKSPRDCAITPPTWRPYSRKKELGPLQRRNEQASFPRTWLKMQITMGPCPGPMSSWEGWKLCILVGGATRKPENQTQQQNPKPKNNPKKHQRQRTPTTNVGIVSTVLR